MKYRKTTSRPRARRYNQIPEDRPAFVLHGGKDEGPVFRGRKRLQKIWPTAIPDGIVWSSSRTLLDVDRTRWAERWSVSRLFATEFVRALRSDTLHLACPSILDGPRTWSRYSRIINIARGSNICARNTNR